MWLWICQVVCGSDTCQCSYRIQRPGKEQRPWIIWVAALLLLDSVFSRGCHLSQYNSFEVRLHLVQDSVERFRSSQQISAEARYYSLKSHLIIEAGTFLKDKQKKSHCKDDCNYTMFRLFPGLVLNLGWAKKSNYNTLVLVNQTYLHLLLPHFIYPQSFPNPWWYFQSQDYACNNNRPFYSSSPPFSLLRQIISLSLSVWQENVLIKYSSGPSQHIITGTLIALSDVHQKVHFQRGTNNFTLIQSFGIHTRKGRNQKI